jgi:hypothetical protein
MSLSFSRRRGWLVLIVLMLCALPTAAQDAAPARDGQHDFDFMFGTWRVTLKRLVKPLTGSTTWIEYEGTQTTRKVWDGKANFDEFVSHSKTEKEPLQGLTVRLYNPATREWSIYWANAKNGIMAMPPTVGHFTNGRGQFFDKEDFNGKPIVVRYTWSDITANSAKFEQAFSPDDGKTWEPNWISTITRTSHEGSH